MSNHKLEDDILRAATKIILSSSDGVQGISNLISSISKASKQKEAVVKEPIVVHRFVADSDGETEANYWTRQIQGPSVADLLRQLAEECAAYEEEGLWEIMNVTVSWQEDDYLANIVLRHNS